MKKRITLILTILLVVCFVASGCGASWDGIADDAVVAQVGDNSINYLLLKYYSAQQEIGQEIATKLLEEQGYKPEKAKKLSTQDYLNLLMQNAAVSQLAEGKEGAVTKEEALEVMKEELTQGGEVYDYLKEYNDQLKEKMNLNDAELLNVAAEDRYISLNAGVVLKEVVDGLKESVPQDRLTEEIAKKLQEMTSGIEMKQMVPKEGNYQSDFKELAEQAAILY